VSSSLYLGGPLGFRVRLLSLGLHLAADAPFAARRPHGHIIRAVGSAGHARRCGFRRHVAGEGCARLLRLLRLPAAHQPREHGGRRCELVSTSVSTSTAACCIARVVVESEAWPASGAAVLST